MSTSITSDGKTPTKVGDMEKCIVVKCGNKTAEFYPSKLRKTGKSISKCIKHLGKWLSPSEFESMSGMQHTRKWKQSIKVEGRPLGEWIDEHCQEACLENSQQCAKQPENVLGKDSQSADTSTGVIHNVLDSDNNGLHNAHITDDNVRQQPLAREIPVMQCTANVPSNPPDTVHGSSLNTDLNKLLRDLELQLSTSFKELVDQAIQSMRSCIEEEVKSFRRQLEALNERVTQLEEKVRTYGPQHTHEDREHPEIDSPKSKMEQSSPQVVVQDQLSDLKSQVDILASKQVQFEKSKERERRRCNIIIRSFQEPDAESVSDLSVSVQKLLKETLKVHYTPTQSLRIGKKEKGKNRLVLVKMATFQERVAILKAAKLLRGSGIFIKEDLSKSERSYRKVLVDKMMKARAEGKKAFIRYTDGKLIVDGKPIDCVLTPNPRNCNGSQQ